MQFLNTLTVLALVVMSFALIVAVPVLHAHRRQRPVQPSDSAGQRRVGGPGAVELGCELLRGLIKPVAPVCGCDDGCLESTSVWPP